MKNKDKKVFIVEGLQMYGYELSLFLKTLEQERSEIYVGFDDIESLILVHVLAFEKILKMTLVALESSIDSKQLRALGHSPKKIMHKLSCYLQEYSELSRFFNIEVQNDEFELFMEIIEELSTVRRRYDKIDFALGQTLPSQSILNRKYSQIMTFNNKQIIKEDKIIINFIYIQTLTFIYLISLLLGEINDGLHQESLVSRFNRKYRLTVMNDASIERKFMLLASKKTIWEEL